MILVKKPCALVGKHIENKNELSLQRQELSIICFVFLLALFPLAYKIHIFYIVPAILFLHKCYPTRHRFASQILSKVISLNLFRLARTF